MPVNFGVAPERERPDARIEQERHLPECRSPSLDRWLLPLLTAVIFSPGVGASDYNTLYSFFAWVALVLTVPPVLVVAYLQRKQGKQRRFVLGLLVAAGIFLAIYLSLFVLFAIA